MKRMINLLLALVVLVLIAMVPSCGARKVDNNINKGSTTETEKVVEEEREIVKEEVKTTEVVSDKTDKTKEKTETTTKTTDFDPNTGKKIKETVKTTKTGKSTDRSTKDSKASTDAKKQSEKTKYITKTVLKKITYYTKSKKSWVDNNAFYIMLGGLGVFVIAGFIMYRVISDKVKTKNII